ncbi:AAR2 protein-domain-containing protein [Pelagophyceae sp. CCMP2097]|nr:AAR2 protein-domain-containing protein [Pelagophyceae sp. CCMP2097]|mmetsp:Transcript_19027/g.65405  ORF Transcript_19027/g.65405 Transcript_19027/m.65405 type:complete len:320 (+) Transcript_19027:111-1070(+)
MSSLIVIGGTTQGLEFGVDGFSWQLGARFGGIRGVQQGLHLVVFGAGQGVGRQGVWVCLGERDVAALKWDPSKEAVADGGARLALPEGAAVAARRAAAAPDAARHGLGSYPEGHAEVWKRLASHIDESTLERVGLSTNAAFGPGSSGDDEESNAVVDADLAVAKWTALEEPVRVEALRVGASLSAYHTDSSDKLRAVCALRFVDWRGAVAEHALAFVTFVALGSLQALKQWQRLTALLCTCDAMIAGAPEAVGFAPALAGNLEAQLSIFVDADFFRDPISSADDVVRPALKAFFETGSASDDAETRKAVASLEAFANKR